MAGGIRINSKTMWRALDPEFDRAILQLTAELLPGGFAVADEAPSTLEDLCAWLDSGALLTVWSGASDYTIYGSPEVNAAFRAWHDFVHYQQRSPFTLAGEAAVAWSQAEQLRAAFGAHPNARQWRR